MDDERKQKSNEEMESIAPPVAEKSTEILTGRHISSANSPATITGDEKDVNDNDMNDNDATGNTCESPNMTGKLNDETLSTIGNL